MEEENKTAASHHHPWWWSTTSNNYHNIINPTPCLLQPTTTLSDLDEKGKAMLSLLIQEEDGDSFAERAQMYYKNKPVLIKMVKELHTSYRSLAERYNQLSSESVPIIQLPGSSSPSSDSFKHIQNHLHNNIDSKVSFGSSSSSSSSGDSKLETSPHESNPESTVEDPPDHLDQCEISKSADFKFLNRNAELDIGDENQLEAANCSAVVLLDTETVIDKKKKKSTGFEMGQSIHGEFTMGSLNRSEDVGTDMNLQVSKLTEENIQQQCELIRRNDEKRRAIRDLRFQLDKLTAENKTLQNCLKCSKIGTKQNQSQLSKLKALILGKLLG